MNRTIQVCAALFACCAASWGSDCKCIPSFCRLCDEVVEPFLLKEARQKLSDVPPFGGVVIVKDSDPIKKNRFLAVPLSTAHETQTRGQYGSEFQYFHNLTWEEAETLLRTAISGAEQLAGKRIHGEVAILQNGNNRKQCHVHLHIGELKARGEPNAKIAMEDKRVLNLSNSLVEQITGMKRQSMLVDSVLDRSWVIHKAGTAYHFHQGATEYTEQLLVDSN